MRLRSRIGSHQAAMHPNWIIEHGVVPKELQYPAGAGDAGNEGRRSGKATSEGFRIVVAFTRVPRLGHRRDGLSAQAAPGFCDKGDLVWRAQATNELETAGLTPKAIFAMATARRGNDVLK